MITEKPELGEEDLKRVKEYLDSPIHQIDRKPFNPWYFIALTIGSSTGLLLLAMLVTRLTGVTGQM